MNKSHTEHDLRKALFPCEISKPGISVVANVAGYIPVEELVVTN
jgi:hypothetical protein